MKIIFISLIIFITSNKIFAIQQNQLTTIKQEEFIIFSHADIEPEFKGGKLKLMQYLSENIRNSNAKIDTNNLPQKIAIKFYVDTLGKVKDVELLKSSGNSDFDKEVIQIVESMPKWNPGLIKGKAVNCYYTLPIHPEFK